MGGVKRKGNFSPAAPSSSSPPPSRLDKRAPKCLFLPSQTGADDCARHKTNKQTGKRGRGGRGEQKKKNGSRVASFFWGLLGIKIACQGRSAWRGVGLGEGTFLPGDTIELFGRCEEEAALGRYEVLTHRSAARRPFRSA